MRRDRHERRASLEVENPSRRVYLAQVKVPASITAIAAHAVRYQIFVNDGGELMSLDDTLDVTQITWNQLNDATWKPRGENEPVPLPGDWYCIRVHHVSGTQVVHHLTLSNNNGLDQKKFKTDLHEYLKAQFPDTRDPGFHREERKTRGERLN